MDGLKNTIRLKEKGNGREAWGFVTRSGIQKGNNLILYNPGEIQNENPRPNLFPTVGHKR